MEGHYSKFLLPLCYLNNLISLIFKYIPPLFTFCIGK